MTQRQIWIFSWSASITINLGILWLWGKFVTPAIHDYAVSITPGVLNVMKALGY
jgi:hypothetical protein